MVDRKYRDIRVVNRTFSLGEYDDTWTKIESFLFIEVYNILKEFYTNNINVSQYIESFSSESIVVKLPVSMIDKTLIKVKNRSRQLLDASERLSKKRIRYIHIDNDGQYSFDFLAMFPRITYDQKKDRDHLFIKIPSEVYEEMVPIESYCDLDLKLLNKLTSGNEIRLYEILKSHAFKGEFVITFTEIRKQMGFYAKNQYTSWRDFNRAVLKPAVNSINKYRSLDIEVSYRKPRGKEEITFNVILHNRDSSNRPITRSLNDLISVATRKPNLIQKKYIETTIEYCKKHIHISEPRQLFEWIISDIISQQDKQGMDFDFKKAMNAISKQIRTGKYTEPYSHKHLKSKGMQEDYRAEFIEEIHNDIKQMYYKNDLKAIREKYSDQQIIANRFAYLLAEIDAETSD